MTSFEAFILGIIQGLTEFLPVSSSGHLHLMQMLLGFQHLSHYIFFDLICHLGTLSALLIGFRHQIYQVVFHDRKRLLQLSIATLPLFPLVFILKPLKSMFNHIEYLGYFFLLTALILYLGIRLGRMVNQNTLQNNRWRDSVLIGISQAMAILPGISRSGSTISMGRILGWNLNDAVVFSFLLAIPTVLGGVLIEMKPLFDSTFKSESFFTHVSPMQYAIGFVSSFVMGFFGISLLKTVTSKDKFIYFVWYCLAIGVFTILYTLKD